MQRDEWLATMRQASEWFVFATVTLFLASDAKSVEPVQAARHKEEQKVAEDFATSVKPFLTKYCSGCHNEETRESGIRVDHLDGLLPEGSLNLWEGIRGQVQQKQMPPEGEEQPSDEERAGFEAWIARGLHLARTREVARNGSTRRLTVAQYRNTLRELLKLDENLTEILPPDGVSKEGFTNNGSTMQLSPLLVEAYFEIAEKALALAIVDEKQKPVIQHFQMELGKGINRSPLKETLVLGALNHLLRNRDFVVNEPALQKPFAFEPFLMQKQFRFIEGYQGNDTVREWKDFDSIYHAVFACMRGTEGYPKGRAYETVPAGLLLRPAIPSPEIFGESSTYGPHANFKISLRELPAHGRFRVTVHGAKYDDGLLLDRTIPAESIPAGKTYRVASGEKPQQLEIGEEGIYLVEAKLQGTPEPQLQPKSNNLEEGLIGAWKLDGNVTTKGLAANLPGTVVEGSRFAQSPFGESLLLNGNTGGVTVASNPALHVTTEGFTVAAWIMPHELRQGGIVSFGGYGYTHGWLLDMPDASGRLRIETANKDRKHNGTVVSAPGILRPNQWQHVAAIVKRGENQTKLFVNGYEVAQGTIGDIAFDNPTTVLSVGRIPDAQWFMGEIDEVHYYRRALENAELEALIEPGRAFAVSPFPIGTQELQLTLGERHFSGTLGQPAFLIVRMPQDKVDVAVSYAGTPPIEQVVFRKLEETHALHKRFLAFEKRKPRIGVHVGLRRDCGSTLSPVGVPQEVGSTELAEYVFEGAISNFPSPDVEKDNVNYLAGIREIGVRSEYTDGRDMPRLLVRKITFEGPFYDTWPPAPHQNLFIASANRSQPEIYAREILRSFGTRAFRRPITSEEENSLMQTWKDSFAASGDFSQSIQDALLIVLTSPQFLFLVESSQGPEAEALTEWELAAKLSYFLWNGPPDDELLRLASEKSLQASLDAQVDRMIADPRFANFAEQFAAQWLSLDKFDVVKTDAKLFPRLTKEVKEELRKEPARFLQHLVQENLPVTHLIKSDLVLANEVVANYYGCAERTESGFAFVPILHQQEHLGGVLSQAAIQAGLSDGRESNPVKRGAWFARKMIATPPEDPPPNVPKLEDLTQLSLRERLERHRNIQGCIKCHTGIDPWGLPFEQFDAGGLSKTKEVDSRSLLPGGVEVQDFNAFRQHLVQERLDQVAFSTLKHLSIYASGRSLTYNENLQLKEKGLELRKQEYRLRDMIHWTIQSDLFLKK